MKLQKHWGLFTGKWVVAKSIMTFVWASVVGLLSQIANAQNNSLFKMQDSLGRNIPMTMQQSNLLHMELPEARSMRMHDIIQVRVDELARMSSDGRSERRKNATLNGILNDWVRLNGFRKLEKDQQADGDPQVQGSLNEIYRA